MPEKVFTSSQPEIRIAADAAELNLLAAREFYRCAQEATTARGRFCVALSGGSTPRSVNSLLAERDKNEGPQLPWEKIYVFFGDERHVPPDHPESNYLMARES